jgi:L-ascorbate metabolism protein UlaG (beta-lactamase superfamily)
MAYPGPGGIRTVRIAWHGSAAYTLEIAGCEVLVDPFFSPASAYGPWYTPNTHAPDPAGYLAEYAPDLMIITHGHFDHCDLAAVKALTAIRPLQILTSAAVAAALQRHCGLGADSVTTIAPGQRKDLGAVQAEAFAGVHWLTNAEGDEAARKLDRPDRFGVFPAGGPSLGFVVTAGGERAYLSGDTVLEGIPEAQAPVAVISTGTRMAHPVTKEIATPVVTLDDLPAVARRLHARVLAAVHWDFPLFLDPFDAEGAGRRMAAEHPACRLVIPSYNTWTELRPEG